MPLPKRLEDRLAEGLKRFQPVLTSARSRDVNEADTVVIVTDLLADLFGYDKYAEVIREFAIRNTVCDLAIKIDDKPRLLVEVKAIGLELKDTHVKQAVDYAANLGIEWAVLTNGVLWQTYRITFGRPIDQELVLDFDLLDLNPRASTHLERLYPLSRDGLLKAALTEYHAQKEAMSRFSLAALLMSEPMLKILRRELRRLSPGVSVDVEDIEKVLAREVLKREVVEGEKADEAKKKIRRVLKKQLRERQPRATQVQASGGEEDEEEEREDVEERQEKAIASVALEEAPMKEATEQAPSETE